MYTTIVKLERPTAFIKRQHPNGMFPAAMNLRRLTEDEDDLFEDVGPALFIAGFDSSEPGCGRILMAALLEACDLAGETLALVPAASGRLSQAALVAWYERLGFVNEVDYMVRLPQQRQG